MKGIGDRQKTIVKPRENVQKHISQQKNFQKSNANAAGRSVRKENVRRKK